MPWVAATIILALLEYLALGYLVGYAREKYGVPAPAMSGHPVFERYFRVQMNTLELLIAFVPGMWLFGLYISPLWAAILGFIFMAGRVVYLLGYIRDPKSRGAGFGMSFFPTAILLLGGLFGALRAALI